jgi:hypothetical protein
VARGRDLLAALQGAQPGIAGITAAPGGATWDAFASAQCPGLTGDAAVFVVLEDGTIVVAEGAEGSLEPLAQAVEQTLGAPYRAAAARTDGEMWSVVAESVRIVELPGLDGEAVDLTVVAGERELTVDGERASRPLPALDALAEEHADVALHAERVDGDTFAVDVFPL